MRRRLRTDIYAINGARAAIAALDPKTPLLHPVQRTVDKASAREAVLSLGESRACHPHVACRYGGSHFWVPDLPAIYLL